jgi:hypothetical protein
MSFRLSPPCRNKGEGVNAPAITERLPGGEGRHRRLPTAPREGACHAPARDAERIPSSAAQAPPNIAAQIYTPATMTKMIAHCTQGGESIDQAIAWGADELEGFMRG